MITPQTIQQITSRIDIIDVVGEFVKLKKKRYQLHWQLPIPQRKVSFFYRLPSQRNLQMFWMW